MALTSAERKRFRADAHSLKPIVMMGQHGYTAAIVAAIDEALNDHELIKIKMRGVEREQRRAVADEICSDLDAEFVALVGTVATIYRRNEQSEK